MREFDKISRHFLFSDHFLILVTISLDDLLILLRENCCRTLSGLRGFIKELADERLPFGPLNDSNRDVGAIVIWGTTITRMLPLINMAASLRERHDNPQLTISEIDIQQSKSSTQGAHEIVSFSINVAITLAWYQHTNDNI